MAKIGMKYTWEKGKFVASFTKNREEILVFMNIGRKKSQ